MRRNPPTVPLDTPVEVWRRQHAAVAALSVAERLEAWAALTREMSRLEAVGIRATHPNYSDHEVFLTQVHRRYGDKLFREAWPDEVLPDP